MAGCAHHHGRTGPAWSGHEGAGARRHEVLRLRPEILAAAFDELKKQGMRSASITPNSTSPRMCVDHGALGLTTMEHCTGCPRRCSKQTVQAYPATTISRRVQRFGEAAGCGRRPRLRAAKIRSVITELLASASRSIRPSPSTWPAAPDARARADWHDQYTLPSLWSFFEPNRINHGSFFYDWAASRRWVAEQLRALDGLRQRLQDRGRVTVGSDSGYIYQVYGFGTIQEMELLREAASIRWSDRSAR